MGIGKYIVGIVCLPFALALYLAGLYVFMVEVLGFPAREGTMVGAVALTTITVGVVFLTWSDDMKVAHKVGSGPNVRK